MRGRDEADEMTILLLRFRAQALRLLAGYDTRRAASLRVWQTICRHTRHTPSYIQGKEAPQRTTNPFLYIGVVSLLANAMTCQPRPAVSARMLRRSDENEWVIH